MSREDGSATVEYIAVAVVLMVPIAYAVIAFTQIQSAKFGVVGAAQQAARAYVNANSDYLGRYAAVRAAAIAGRNHGLLIGAGEVTVSCSETNCLTPGTEVTVDVTSSVQIPYAPMIGRLPLHAQAVMTVDAYRADPA